MGVDRLGKTLSGIHKKLAKYGPLSAEDIEIVHSKVVEHSKDTNVREKIKLELMDLARTTKTIEMAFADIAARIERLDNSKAMVVDGEYQTYSDSWKKLHERYTKIMFDSRQTANAAKAKVSTLMNVLLPDLQDPNKDVEYKRFILSEYVKTLTPPQTEGQDLEFRLLRLTQAVQSFRKRLWQDFKDMKTDLTDEQKKLDDEIIKLQKQLDGTPGVWRNIWHTLRLGSPHQRRIDSNTDARPFLMGTAGITALAPTTSLSFLSAALSALSNVRISYDLAHEEDNHRNELKKEIKQLRIAQEELVSQVRRLRDVQELLNSLNESFSDIVSRLTAIQEIWRLIYMDINQLQTTLEDTSGLLGNYHENMIGHIHGLYDTICVALDAYILHV
ncbi:hypothetical protein CPB84DRAFT_1774159 [Gymnopilus junonius]|uniref:Uncharacterized protein n=1 Tax=Gymnopilus junonius TaxID=109634 RepID=A0A9P5NSZ5_GYMJU|nr:hypothetical protein CPB84DRAFT_1774159 [Gymnopilus junonius]